MAVPSQQNSWLAGVGAGRAPAIIDAPFGSGGGKLNSEKLKAWAPALAILASAMLAPEGYRGMAAGSAAQNWNLLSQQEEERKRQAWLDEIAEEERRWRQEERDAWKRMAGWLSPELEAMGADTPGTPGTEGTPAEEYPWNKPGYGAHVAPEDKPSHEAAQATGRLPADRPAVAGTPATPGKKGDQLARAWAEMVKQSGGAPWAIQGALEYYMGSKTPKTQTPARSLDLTLKSLSDDNPFITALLQPGLSNEEYDKWAEMAYEYEVKKKKTPEDLEKARLELALLKARIDAANRSNQGKDRDGGGGLKIDPVRLQAEYDDYVKTMQAQGVFEDEIIEFKDWLKAEYGEPVLRAYNAEVSGSPLPSGLSQTGKNLGYTPNAAYTEDDWYAADRLIQAAPSNLNDPKSEKGSIRNAIILALQKQVDPAVVMALIDRYNRQNAKKMYLADWKKIAGVK